MKVEAILLTISAVFFFAVGAVYVGVGGEPAGAVLLTIAIVFAGLIGGWLWLWVSRNPPRAEDRADGTMADETGELGTFVTGSWRPFSMAVAATIIGVGLAIGPWLALIGVALLVYNVIGLVQDSG